MPRYINYFLNILKINEKINLKKFIIVLNIFLFSHVFVSKLKFLFCDLQFISRHLL